MGCGGLPTIHPCHAYLEESRCLGLNLHLVFARSNEPSGLPRGRRQLEGRPSEIRLAAQRECLFDRPPSHHHCGSGPKPPYIQKDSANARFFQSVVVARLRREWGSKLER